MTVIKFRYNLSVLLTFHFLQESSGPPSSRVMEPDTQEGG